jgi:ribose transport system permease protein
MTGRPGRSRVAQIARPLAKDWSVADYRSNVAPSTGMPGDANPAPSGAGDDAIEAGDRLDAGFANSVLRALALLLLVPWAGVLVALLVIAACLSIATPYFLTTGNLLGTVARYFSWICIAGFGEGLVMGLSGLVCAIGLSAGMPLALAIILALLCGCTVGLINALAITRIGLNPFITTLASLSVVRGLTYGLVQGEAVTTPDNGDGLAFGALGNGGLSGIPYPVLVMLAIGLILLVLLNQTSFGRRVYAVGGNEGAARLLGLKVNRIKLIVYMISGVTSAVGGVLLTAKAGTALPDAAQGYELDVIAAVIIGGTSLSGGRGTIPGILIGAALLGVINNGIVLIGLAGYWQQCITGLVITAAATLDIARGRLQTRLTVPAATTREA